MGKRKQKVRWSSVDGISWSCNDQASSYPDGSAGVVKGSAVPGSGGGTRRSSAQGWTSSLAPRFERKAVAKAEQKHIYYEGELCVAEDLLNGFTKIRSKNLDILFKRDYYEQRMATQQLITEELMKLKEKNLQENGSSESLDKELEKDTNVHDHEERGDIEMSDETPKTCFSSFDQMDPDDIPEFKPMNVQVETPACNIDSGHTSPFYINHLPHDFPASHEYEAPIRPNLYLYSPSDNSLIPCKEIIIPNPVMSPEGPVYSGPTNIYLAYPVQGPDGKGYITQPFATPGSAGSYLSQDSASYSPSISYDGSTSPPPLANYHPTNWINQDHTSLIPHVRDNTEGAYDPQPMDRSTDKHSYLSHPLTGTKSTTESPGETVSVIPGLPQNSSVTTPKKSQKRRKKKTKPQNLLEHRGSTSSESETQKSLLPEECNMNLVNDDEVRPLQIFKEFVSIIPVEPIQEIYLTDDLADSLVNPPTDPEVSDEEVSQESLTMIPSNQNMNTNGENRDQNSSSNITNITNLAVIANINNNEDKYNMETKDEGVITNTEKNEVDLVNDDTLNTSVDLVRKVNEDEHGSEIIKIESKNNIIESLSAEEIIMKDVQVKIDSLVEPVEIKCMPKDVGSNIGNIKYYNLEDKNTPCLGRKIKSKNNKNKKHKKLVLKSECDTEYEISSVNSNLHNQNSPELTNVKKSYSSVIKSSLVKESNTNPTISSQPKVEIVPIPSPLPTTPTCPAVQSNTEQDSDNWQKAPLAAPKHENWEKTSRKRKPRNMKIQFEDSPQPEEIPVLEVVYKIEEGLKPQEVIKVLEKETVQEEENKKTEQDKKKLSRKKKKQGSEGTDEINAAHRVVIRDDQIQIQPPESRRRASEVLSSSFLESVNASSHGDFMVISELGSGISRGCMNYGRLYQGKYIPPERTDGLPEEESVNKEATIEEVICENLPLTTSEDIDLD